MIENFRLDKKAIWISGASSGLGRACAITANALGARVVLNGRNKLRLEETLALLPNPDNAFLLPFDLTDYGSVPGKVAQVVQDIGPFHGVINAAGISMTLPFRSISDEQLDDFFNVNVKASLVLTRHILKPSHFSKVGGSVVFMTSVMAHNGESGKVLYSMTKGALMAAARALAIELAPKKIRVNCISPGVVETPMTQNAVYNQDEASKLKVHSMHPLGLGVPEDVANATVFLLSDASRWITGTQLILDGGYTAR